MDKCTYLSLDFIKLLCQAYDEICDSYPESYFEGEAVYDWIEECCMDMLGENE